MAAPPAPQMCVFKTDVHCNDCGEKIRRKLHTIHGVYAVNVDAEQGRVTIAGNVDPNIIKNALEMNGGRVFVWELLSPSAQAPGPAPAPASACCPAPRPPQVAPPPPPPPPRQVAPPPPPPPQVAPPPPPPPHAMHPAQAWAPAPAPALHPVAAPGPVPHGYAPDYGFHIQHMHQLADVNRMKHIELTKSLKMTLKSPRWGSDHHRPTGPSTVHHEAPMPPPAGHCPAPPPPRAGHPSPFDDMCNDGCRQQ